MSAIQLVVDGAPPLSPTRLSGAERLGRAATFELDVEGPAGAPVLPSSVLRRQARILFDTEAGQRAVAGVVTRFTVKAGDHAHRRAYRMTIQSAFALLALRRPARTFQDLSAPDIVEQVARGAGYANVRRSLVRSYPPLRYVAEVQETDEAFFRRVCEQHGLVFRFEADDAGEVLVLLDDTTGSEDPYPDPIPLVVRAAGSHPGPIAFNGRRRLRRRAGKVTVRDYDPEKPRLVLEGSAAGGGPREQDVEVYEAPAGFGSPDEGATQARIRMEALRAEAAVLTFETNALALAPGAGVTLADEAHDEVLAGGDRYTVIGVSTRWTAEEGEIHASVEAIPRAVPYRLPRVTPRPRFAGVQSAWVTGEQGQEIHPDKLGRVHLRFHWDLHGAGDHRSSLPVRVMQPHVSGPMITPRVGWEVFVMFEDGDPDRPYVIGRSYNSKQPPPLPLPANKSVTSIATDSSPGAGARSVIQLDDAAGREHLLIHAPFAKTTTISGNRAVQTAKNENVEVGAAQTETIGGLEQISVKLGFSGGYGSRDLNVGAAQLISVGGDFATQVGPELAIVAGLLGEKVGNPVTGALNLAASHALAAVGAKGALGQIAAGALGAARAAGEAAYNARDKGDAAMLDAAKEAAKASGIGTAASFLPGGEAILAAVTGSSTPMPWDHGRPNSGPAAPGGGAAGAGGADGGPAGPGPGHRNVVASGTYSEVVGAVYALMTPGPVSWVTAAAATTIIRSSHTSTAAKAGLRVAGGLGEWQGALFINSKGFISRKILGLSRTSISGALSISSGGNYTVNAKAMLTLKVGGSLTLTGAPVTFKCGASTIVAAPGGVLLQSPAISVSRTWKQSGSLTHK